VLIFFMPPFILVLIFILNIVSGDCLIKFFVLRHKESVLIDDVKC